MCGICGVRRFGEEPISQEQIRTLLIGNERRGNHATGVCLQQMDGSLQVYKDDEPATKVVMSYDFTEWLNENLREDTLCFIGHTRLATKGPTTDPKNNHPLWDGTTAVVHNGCLTNDDYLFRELKLERVAETDSDIFRAILSKEGLTTKGVNELNKVSGSAAIAAVSTNYPGKLLLARSGNPIVLATTENHLIWSSEKQPIYESLRPFYKQWGIWLRKMKADAGFTTMSNDTAWLIGDRPREDELGDQSWIEWHQAFKVANYFNARNYEVHGNYNQAWMRGRGGSKKIMVRCRNKKCGVWLPLTQSQRTNIANLVCGSCETPLREKK